MNRPEASTRLDVAGCLEDNRIENRPAVWDANEATLEQKEVYAVVHGAVRLPEGLWRPLGDTLPKQRGSVNRRAISEPLPRDAA
jgi:hypothetical protein